MLFSYLALFTCAWAEFFQLQTDPKGVFLPLWGTIGPNIRWPSSFAQHLRRITVRFPGSLFQGGSHRATVSCRSGVCRVFPVGDWTELNERLVRRRRPSEKESRKEKGIGFTWKLWSDYDIIRIPVQRSTTSQRKAGISHQLGSTRASRSVSPLAQRGSIWHVTIMKTSQTWSRQEGDKRLPALTGSSVLPGLALDADSFHASY